MIALPVALSLAGLLTLRYTLAGGAARGLVAVLFAASLLLGVPTFMKEGGCTNAFLLFCAMVGVTSVGGIWGLRAAGLGERPRAAVLLLPAVFLAVETVASFGVYDEKAADPYIAPAVRFVEKNRDKLIYFPKHNYVTYLGSGQYYADDNMTWDFAVAGIAEPESVVKGLQSGRWDYIIGDFHTGRLNSLRDAGYRETGERLGEFAVHARRGKDDRPASP